MAVAKNVETEDVEKVLNLNETGATILRALTDGADIPAIVSQLLAEYDVSPQEAEAEVNNFIDMLKTSANVRQTNALRLRIFSSLFCRQLYDGEAAVATHAVGLREMLATADAAQLHHRMHVGTHVVAVSLGCPLREDVKQVEGLAVLGEAPAVRGQHLPSGTVAPFQLLESHEIRVFLHARGALPAVTSSAYVQGVVVAQPPAHLFSCLLHRRNIFCHFCHYCHHTAKRVINPVFSSTLIRRRCFHWLTRFFTGVDSPYSLIFICR